MSNDEDMRSRIPLTALAHGATQPPSPAPLCKGAWRLGTACGKCNRCHDTAAGEIKTLQNDLDMYVNAWLRELGGRTFNKSHLIDALVLTTRDIKRKADRFDREFGQDMPKWQYAEMSAPWFEGRGTL